MAYASSRFDTPFSSMLTPWVKRLLIANTAVFAVSIVLGLTPWGGVTDWFALQPSAVLTRPWTLLTYAFLHGGLFHFFFNMLGLFFFGPPLEERWGGRPFLKFYAVAAAGGAVLSIVGALVGLFPMSVAVIGASAAVNGLLVGFAMAWPDREIYFFGVFPVKAKWFVVGMAVFSMMAAASGVNDGTAHLAHIGGFLFAFLYLKSPWAPNPWGELPAARRAHRPNPVAAWIGSRKREEAQPRRQAQRPAPTAIRTARAERELLDDVDRILDKISAEGLGSLTPEERQRLDEVSKRYRTN